MENAVEFSTISKQENENIQVINMQMRLWTMTIDLATNLRESQEQKQWLIQSLDEKA